MVLRSCPNQLPMGIGLIARKSIYSLWIVKSYSLSNATLTCRNGSKIDSLPSQSNPWSSGGENGDIKLRQTEDCCIYLKNFCLCIIYRSFKLEKVLLNFLKYFYMDIYRYTKPVTARVYMRWKTEIKRN